MMTKKKDSAEKATRDIRRAVPQGRHQPEPVLPLVERVPGGRREALAKTGGMRRARERLHYLDITPKTDFLPILCEKTTTLAPLSSLYPT